MNLREKINSLDKREDTVCILSRAIREFIDSKTEIKPVLMYPGFYLDDMSLYKEAIKYVDNYNSTIAITMNLICFIILKFGMFGDMKIRKTILFNGREDEDGIIGGVSITDFIGKNAALCLERASFLHNCLTLLDIPDTLIIGNIMFGDSDESHAYNLITTKNKKYLLVDATNYMVSVESHKYFPCIFKLTEREYYGLIAKKIMFEASQEKNPIKKEFFDIDYLYY